jgi:hypothetical protein
LSYTHIPTLIIGSWERTSKKAIRDCMNRDHEKCDRTMQRSSGELMVLEHGSSMIVQQKPGQPTDTMFTMGLALIPTVTDFRNKIKQLLYMYHMIVWL